MKICFFADGTSVHTVRWCNHFASLGHEVHLITFREVILDEITVHYIDAGKISVSGGNWKVLLTFLKVKKKLKHISPDVFHALYATSYGITGALCGFHPYIITALGSDVLISPNQSKFYRNLLKFAFSKADWITAMSDQMKDVIVKLNTPSEKVSTVPFGVDPTIFNANNYRVPEDEFVITSTRNFEKVYNIPHLIRAVDKVKSIIPNFRLNLIGEGTLKNELEEMVLKKGLQKNVLFMGKISQVEIAKVLNHSHLFISVSLSDGNNISLNEAMACGTYCISTDIPANRQWINDEENGFLIQIDDVDRLAERIEKVYHNFHELQHKALPLNQKIIAERGVWATNMHVVEEKYTKLIHTTQ